MSRCHCNAGAVAVNACGMRSSRRPPFPSAAQRWSNARRASGCRRLMIAWFRADPVKSAAERAYSRLVEQARRVEFFREAGVPDTVDGRFELICLHAFLLLHRLKGGPSSAARFGQRFVDAMCADFDRSLREMGTGDLSVGREVKRMVQGFYGRIQAYEAGLAGGDEMLSGALMRNLYGTVPDAQPYLPAVAAYLRRETAQLAAAPLAELLAGTVSFGPPPAATGAAAPANRGRR